MGPAGATALPRASDRQGWGGARRAWQLRAPGQVGPGCGLSPGRKDVTLRKLDIKVETVNREPLTMHSDREDDTASVSTATRVMKAIYSVSVRSPLPAYPLLHTLGASPTPGH